MNITSLNNIYKRKKNKLDKIDCNNKCKKCKSKNKCDKLTKETVALENEIQWIKYKEEKTQYTLKMAYKRKSYIVGKGFEYIEEHEVENYLLGIIISNLIKEISKIQIG